MSARPALALLPPEELDLLLSRALDDDLPPEEVEELERYLATDAAARRRRDEMAALVRSVRELPTPEPPFALATRVTSQVTERAHGVGASWNRLGFYPPAGLVPAVIAVAVVAALVYTLTGTPKPPAAPVQEEEAAPVRVFFQDSVTSLRWNVEVAPETPGWRVAEVPESTPSGPVDARYRVTLDAQGRVSSLRPLSTGTSVRPDVAQLLRDLVFEPIASKSAGREVDVRIIAQ